MAQEGGRSLGIVVKVITSLLRRCVEVALKLDNNELVKLYEILGSGKNFFTIMKLDRLAMEMGRVAQVLHYKQEFSLETCPVCGVSLDGYLYCPKNGEEGHIERAIACVKAEPRNTRAIMIRYVTGLHLKG